MMKKISVLLIAIVLSSVAGFSQNVDQKWGIGIGPGMYFNLTKMDENNNDMGDEEGLVNSFYVSRYLSPSFDILLNADVALNDFETDWANPTLNLRYKFNKNAEARFLPYIFGGVGYLWDNNESGVNFDAGLGVKTPITDNTSAFLQLAYVHGIDGDRYSEGDPNKEVHDNHLKLSGIFEFALGSALDTDMDGVPDKRDNCPGTPAGVVVDELGCPIDTDGDGVPDYKDECPEEAGSVGLKGCPDRDGDGVADKDDKCPDVAGLVKFNGCPDSDGDGVVDSMDKCPNTPKGCAVDATGCPVDSDNDGVIDCEDKCPNVAGTVANNGCPEEAWRTLEIPTVYFDFDRSFIRNEHKEELDKLAEELINSNKQYSIVVGGHTDNVGTDAYNMGLSEKRAQEVVKYLLSKGVDNAYVGSNYYGESRPAVPNTNAVNRQLNRRVEFEEAKIKK